MERNVDECIFYRFYCLECSVVQCNVMTYTVSECNATQCTVVYVALCGYILTCLLVASDVDGVARKNQNTRFGQ